ncbi:SDR family NAD(P)-dependent oxidoreductase [Dactylosporangium sucinum]|uniref:SDR family NAD(P)-dependent oxidoreductase n=1 Tax=Dactylosporangium sucinum TaxID=1424081 RepID=UPI00227C61CA|nr:SDR family NAD(P)-dependent oxidoreductase [Dactylosporangium sucinum]
MALVTGGGTGIGAAITEVLADHGAHVVIASRKLDNLTAVADRVTGRTGRRIVPVRTDVRDEAEVAALVQHTVDELGTIDILVNNAGGSYMFPILGTTPARWDNSIALNLRAPYLTTHYTLPHMVEARRGAIVNISSVAAIRGVRGGAAYAAGKAGLQAFTQVVAGEHGPHGIRANAIAVGTVASEGALRSWERFGMTVADIEREVPLRRVGRPADIAWGVLYLASDMSSWMTGHTLVIDGGPPMPGLAVAD